MRPPMINRALNSMSGNDQLRSAIMSNHASRELVSHYIAGSDLEAAVRVVGQLQARGLYTSVQQLSGRPVLRDAQQASEAAQEATRGYLAMAASLAAAGVAERSELTVPLAVLGLHSPDGEQLALQQAQVVCQAADQAGCWVTIDIEQADEVDAGLAVLEQLRQDYPSTGIALRASWRRTEADCRTLAEAGSRVRLSKGYGNEPERIAFAKTHQVRLSFVRCLRVLMTGDGYPMVNTHDSQIIEITSELARRTGRGPDSFEYQMAYGVRPLEQRRLVDIGNTVRVLVPYGPEWYSYYLRQLAERPTNIPHLLRSLVGRR